VHRDIKPDNLLLDANDVLKVVDFGVSEMFTKDNDRLKSSTGSPAFASPELSLGGLHNVSGKAADIWAMGVTLYALIYGVLPFNNQNILELYDNIRNQESVPSYFLANSRVDIPKDEEPNLVDLFQKILDKNPDTRIKMPELRVLPQQKRTNDRNIHG
jgi:serine/threonine protein kinase